MDGSGPPPPGWYEDPEDASRSRWWTGAEWGPRATHPDDPKDPPSTFERGPADTGSGSADGEGDPNALDAFDPKRSAGWYPDPQDQDRLRYWDGNDWNDHQSADDSSEHAAPNPGQLSSATGTESQMAGIAVAKKPLTAREEKQLRPGSKELGIAALIALGAGSGALAGFRIWIALVAAVIVSAALFGHNDLLHRSPKHPSPARSDGRQLAVFWSAWITAALFFAVGSTSEPSDSATDTNVAQESAEPESSAAPEPEPEPEPNSGQDPDAVEAALISAVGFDGMWPFGTQEARIECLPEEGLAVELNGHLYALNGVAISAGYEELTLETPDSLWLDNAETGSKVSLRDFTQLARDICAGASTVPDLGPTTGQQLALIDGARVRDWPEYERRLAQAGERCGEPEIDVADKVVRVQQLLDERGLATSLLEIMEDGILASIPPEEAGNLDCAEILSLWLVLTIG